MAAAHVHLPGPCRQSRHHTCRGVAAQSPAVGADGGTGAYAQACAHVPALSLSCVRARMHARAPTCMLTRTLARTRPHAHAHAHAHTRTHAHTHTRAQTHEPTHTQHQGRTGRERGMGHAGTSNGDGRCRLGVLHMHHQGRGALLNDRPRTLPQSDRQRGDSSPCGQSPMDF